MPMTMPMTAACRMPGAFTAVTATARTPSPATTAGLSPPRTEKPVNSPGYAARWCRKATYEARISSRTGTTAELTIGIMMPKRPLTS